MNHSKLQPTRSPSSQSESAHSNLGAVFNDNSMMNMLGPGATPYYGNQAMQEMMREKPESAAWDFYGHTLDVTDEELQGQISSWRQTKEGNCATVAVSKAATDAMGTRAFQDIEETASGLSVTLRDGTVVELSITELEEAQAASAFKGQNESALAFGTLQYAVAAKQALAAKHEDAKTYADALRALNNGESPNRVAKFLGLQNDKVGISSSQLAPGRTSPAFGGRDSVVAWSPKHAVFADRTTAGHTADHYGSGVSYDGADTNARYRRSKSSNNVVSAFSFKRDSGTVAE